MNQSINKRLSISQLNTQKGVICFYAYYAIMTLTKAIGLDSSNSTYNLLFGLGCLLLLYKVVVTDYSLTEIIKLVVLLVISGLSAVIAHEKTIMLFAITIMGLKYCDFTQSVRVAFWVRVVMTSSFILLSLAGVFNDGLADLMTTNFKWVQVYDFDYSTPNNAFINVFIIIVLYLYLNYERINYKYFIVTSIITVLFYQLTNSRTGTLLFFALWIIIFMDKFITRISVRKLAYGIFAILPALCGIFSCFATIMYQPSGSYAWEFVNRIFSGRLNITQNYYRAIGIPLIPTASSIMESHNSFGFIDNLYMNVLLNDGFIIAVIVLAVITVSNYRLYKAEYYKELIFIAIFSMYAMLEEFPLNPIVNPFVMLAGITLYNEVMIGGVNTSLLKIFRRKALKDEQA